MSIAAAKAKFIIDQTHSMKQGAASVFLADQIRKQQASLNAIVAKSAKPKGWTLGAHSELIQMLISAENALRNQRAAA